MASLSSEQATAYLDRIALPTRYRQQLLEGPDGPHALEAVTGLQQHHMAAVPFENLDLHYSEHHSLSEKPDVIFSTVVEQRRGGTCPQVHQLFAQLLRRFGFGVYCSGGRLNAPASVGAAADVDKYKVNYGALIHLSTLVTIQGRTHLVDTATGPAASPTPVPLVHDQPAIDIASRQRRMLYTSLPDAISADKWWRLQIREPDDDDWMDVCCFTEQAWRPVDFVIMVRGMDQLGLGWFRSMVVCYRVLLEDGIPVGYLLLLHDELRRSYRGDVSVVQKLYNEQDRIQLLDASFGVRLGTEMQQCIVGTEAELKDDAYDFYG